MIELPACFLSFDDWHYREWHGLLNILEYNKAKVTFYVAFNSGDEKIGVTTHIPKADEWDMLRNLRDEGHTIGYHSYRHKGAKTTLEKLGIHEYLKNDMVPGLWLLRDYGFIIKHFAYPHGSRSDKTDEILNEYFVTLRGTITPVEIEFYDEPARFPKALDIHEPETIDILKRAIEEKKIIYLFGHNPESPGVMRKLAEILKFGRDGDIHFYSMDEK